MTDLPLTPSARARLDLLRDLGWEADITFTSEAPSEARIGLQRAGSDVTIAACTIPMAILQSPVGGERLDTALKGLAIAVNVELPLDDHENLHRYLETVVRHWRTERDLQKAAMDAGTKAVGVGDDDPKLRHCMALCYVDAYQSVAASMLGELIPQDPAPE